MLVKICGLSNVIDAQVACNCGADALGFVIGGKILPVEIEPSAQSIRPFIQKLEARVKTFLVTHLLIADEILALADYLGVSGIQISEPIATSELTRVRTDFKGEIIKTVAVTGEDSFAELKRCDEFCDFVLLDSRVGGYTGGTGVVSDWELCRQLVTESSKPVFLAGGLTPQNVAEGLRRTEAHGADVSTGVSSFGDCYLKKDRKDCAKIKAFITAAKGCQR